MKLHTLHKMASLSTAYHVNNHVNHHHQEIQFEANSKKAKQMIRRL